MIYKLGELFCGPGGIALGAITANIEDPNFKIVHKWATDYDFDTCETYRNNICPNDQKSVICKNIRDLDISSLKRINSLAFGFPCNDFSIVGEQKGIHGEFGPLYKYGIHALNLFCPDWFLAENVGGLRSANNGQAIHQILNDMRNAGNGYKLFPHFYRFEDYGVPQTRHRLIIIGIRENLNFDFKIPSPAPYRKIDNSCQRAITVPPIPLHAFNNELPKQTTKVIERLKHISPGGNAFSCADKMPENIRLHVKGATISQIYKRLDPKKPSYTVTGSGGGGTHMYHWSENRALTNRERARLQTFPDSYKFFGNTQSVRKQIGMAVPCMAAKIIFEAILRTFANIPYEYTESNFNE